MAPIIKAFTLVVSLSYCVAPVLAAPQSNQSRVKIEVRFAEEKPAEGLIKGRLSGKTVFYYEFHEGGGGEDRQWN